MHGPQTAPIARGCQGQTGTLTEGLTVLGPRSRAEPVDRQNCRRVSSSGASSSKVERKACLFGSEEGGPSSENGQGLRFGPHDHEHAAICSPSKQIKACWKRGTSSLRVRMGKSNTAKAAPQACGTPVANRPSFGGAVPEAQFPPQVMTGSATGLTALTASLRALNCVAQNPGDEKNERPRVPSVGSWPSPAWSENEG